MSEVYIEYRQGSVYPQTGWNPSRPYPEYPFGDHNIQKEPNDAYDMIRSLFQMMGLDRDNFGKKCWNPLGAYISPGDLVLIKPNFVMHCNENRKRRENSMACLVTHPSCLRAVCDYCLIALQGKGEVVIADAPMQDCNLQVLFDQIHFTELLAFYHRQKKPVSFVDLRKYQSEFNRNKVIVNRIYQTGKAVDVDMGSLSMHERRSGARTYQVDNYALAQTEQYHGEHRHIYSLNRIVLQADVVINFCKPKSHRLAGFTAAMKNMVGIIYDKASLPHYTVGSLEEGGDAYLHPSKIKRIISSILEQKIKHENQHQIFRATIDRYLYAVLLLFERRFGKDPYIKGIWAGNDTIWRTVVDLNHIIRFADQEGTLQGDTQRRVLNFADMIIAGEHNGPCQPEAKSLGILMASESAVAMDMTFCKMAGFKEEKIPMIKALREHRPDYLMPGQDKKIMIYANKKEYQGDLKSIKFPQKWHFRPHDSWKSV